MRYALKITALCLLLSPFCFAREAQSDTLFVADNNSLNPVVGKLNASFGIEGAFSVPAPITGMATGAGGQIFVDTATRLYEYTSSGAAVRTFGGGGIDAFGDLAFDGTTLFVADNDSLNPVVGKLDASFGIEGSFSVPAPITGMAAGPGGQIFVDTATRLYEYTSSGAVVRTFGGGGIDALGDLAFDGTTLFVADNTSGNPLVGELNASFGIEGSFSVPAPITGMAAGPGGQIFVDTATTAYEYASSGAVVRTFAGGEADAFGDLAFASTAVPEPATWAMLLVGFAGLGFAGYRATHSVAGA